MIIMNLSPLQKTLNDALSYFLYGSFSADTFRHSLVEKCFLRITPLLDCIKSFQLCGAALNIQKLQIYRGHVSPRQYAETLAGFFSAWERHIPKTNTSRTTASSGKDYASWFNEGGFKPHYRPVHMLHRILDEAGGIFFKRAIVHGSVATLEDTIGFSDMDLAFVVKTSVLKDPAALLRLRNLAREILTLTYAFDPFMHHGPYYIPEIDLAWYPEAMFPSILFGYGVDLFEQNEDLEILARDSTDVSDQMLDLFKDFFQRRASNPNPLKDSFDIEWVLGSTMLLPTLYYQSLTGAFLFKRDSFPRTEPDFSPEEWEPVRTATDVRATLGPRPRPGRALLWSSRLLRWPFLLQEWAKGHSSNAQRAREVQHKTGMDYSARVLKLLEAMQQRLTPERTESCRSSEGNVIQQEPHSFSSNLFHGLANGPFIDIPRKMVLSSYTRTADYLVNHWGKMLKPPVAIYQIGRIAAPGISDLDFILVYEDNAIQDWQQYQPESFPEWIRCRLTHAPYICPESSWADLPCWYPIFNIRHLWGDTLAPPSMPDGDAAGVYLGMLVDYLIVKIPADILWIAWTKPIRLRILLCMLHSLQYTYQLAEKANLPVPDDYKEYVSRIDNLRATWFDLHQERFSMLEELTERVCELAGYLIALVDQVLSEQASSSGTSPSAHGKSDSRCVSPWQYKNALNIAAASRWISDAIDWPNPASFQNVLSLYASVSPALRDYLEAQGFNVRSDWNGGPWGKGLKLHAKAMVDYAEKALAMGIPPQKYIALGYPGINTNRPLQLKSNLSKLIKMLR